MAKSQQQKSDDQANATEPNAGVTHAADSGATGGGDAPQAAEVRDASGVRVRRGKYLRDLDSMGLVVGDDLIGDGDKVSEAFLDSDANKAPSGGKYLVRVGGDS